MNILPALVTFCAMITVTSSSALGDGKESFWKGMPKKLHWEGTVGGEAVEMTIIAGKFVKENHKVEGTEGFYSSVDGYLSEHSQSRNGEMAPHITNWTVRWGGKELKLEKGIYTSVFLPGLGGPNADFDDAHHKGEAWIGPSEDGEELLVTMVSGCDGCSSLIGFTIAKDGRMRRFRLAGRS